MAMAIRYRGNPNPRAVKHNRRNLTQVFHMWRDVEGKGFAVPVWPLDGLTQFPIEIPQIKFICPYSSIYLNDLKLKRMYFNSAGTQIFADYDSESACSFSYYFKQYEWMGTAYRDKSLSSRNSYNSERTTASGVPSIADVMLILRSKTVNADFRADIISGTWGGTLDNPWSQAADKPLLSCDITYAMRWYPQNPDYIDKYFISRGNWSSSTTWAYSGNSVAAYSNIESYTYQDAAGATRVRLAKNL